MLKLKSFVAAIGLSAIAAASWAADITGAGATFPFPIYAKWAEAYKAATGVGLNYQSIGSSGGIQNIGKHKVVNLKIVTNGFQKIQITIQFIGFLI